jgi:transcriptional regulator with XRE-family HTH domain
MIPGPQLVHGLRSEAHRRGFKLEDIAQAARVPNVLLRSIEQGTTIPSPEEAKTIQKLIRREISKRARKARHSAIKSAAGPADAETKYRNERSQIHGESFDSKLEGAVYLILLSRQAAGELDVIQRQDTIYLTRYARVRYIPDFKCRCRRTGDFFWVEAKGYPDKRWPTVKKLWRGYGPGRLEIYTGSYKNPQLNPKDILIPKIILGGEVPSSEADSQGFEEESEL